MIILIHFNGFPDKQNAGEKESGQKLVWLIWSDEPFVDISHAVDNEYLLMIPP